MTKYRIKKDYGPLYYVQKKFLWFWWINVVETSYQYYGSEYRTTIFFGEYEKAKNYIKNKTAEETTDRIKDCARRAFRPKYFYPPLTDKEPM